MAGSEPAQKVRLGRLSETDERRLIEAAQQDRACFGAVYEEYFELVYAYTARRVGNRAAAEDLTSEVFRKALQNLPRFKWTGAPFGAWLLRIASNLIADRAKRTAREPNADDIDKAAGLKGERSSTAARAEGDLEDAERRAYLFRMIDELPEDQRRVVIMRFADERSIREIADVLDRTEGAVKQLQFRALENLRKQFLPQRTQRKN
jgi:RNA polymerase sigma-70 factor, ECF subfamily